MSHFEEFASKTYPGAGGGGSGGITGFPIETNFEATATGTGAQTVGSYTTLANGRAIRVFADVVGRDSVTGDVNGYRLWGVFERTSGTVTQVGTTKVVAFAEEVPALADATLVVNALDIEVQATGDGSNSWDWRTIGRAFENGGGPAGIPIISDTIAANQNDYAPTGVGTADLIRVDGGVADRDITGLIAPTAARRTSIVNVGTTNNLVLKHADVLSAAANRFLIATAVDLTVGPDGVATLVYDDVSSRWRIT